MDKLLTVSCRALNCPLSHPQYAVYHISMYVQSINSKRLRKMFHGFGLNILVT